MSSCAGPLLVRGAGSREPGVGDREPVGTRLKPWSSGPGDRPRCPGPPGGVSVPLVYRLKFEGTRSNVPRT